MMEVEKRETITAADVEKAFDSIFQRGKLKPSQKDILAELKRGSETTIRQHLNQLYLNRLAPEKNDALAIPEELQQEVTALWRKACEHAETQWHEQKAALTSVLQEAQSQQAQMTEAMHEQQAEHLSQMAERKQENQSLSAQLETVLTEKQTAQDELASLGLVLETHKQELSQAKSALVQMSQENTLQAQQFNQQLASEQQRFQTIEDSLHRKIDAARLEKQQSDDAKALLQQQYQQAQQAWLEQQAELQRDRQSLLRQITDLEQQVETKSLLNTHSEQQLSQLSTRYERLETELSSLKERHEVEHDSFIEEKAQSQLRETQLQQLQRALSEEKAQTIKLKYQIDQLTSQISEH